MGAARVQAREVSEIGEIGGAGAAGMGKRRWAAYADVGSECAALEWGEVRAAARELLVATSGRG
ncbi:hypothetical protein ACFOSC_19530 [Streptantibioticus rubrisoli]|uniref:Uncharacterized protein n=1 Tax=Streptantibioticus rubrisoli TaxID=1387313 RepID=A0ABT1PNK4_9ACTN|nr:hypothetical protein [Streptantibioticus rubrisoli]MCQ4046366.1 hypothetical protein [Streptantibioticus rubrisoli]